MPRGVPTAFPAARIASVSLLVIYVALVLAAYRSTLQPGSLGLDIEPCPGGLSPPVLAEAGSGGWCASRVIPGGWAWYYGARPGMRVLSVNGRNIPDSGPDVAPGEAVLKAELLTPSGRNLSLQVVPDAASRGPTKFSVWAVGGLFAILAAAVVARRPDARTAWLFFAFGGSTALGLAVTPSSTGPGPSWARVAQMATLLGAGTSILPFTLSFGSGGGGLRHTAPAALVAALGVLLLIAYGAALAGPPTIFELVRPASLLYVVLSFLAGIVTLAWYASRQPSALLREHARLALWGIALGTLPVVALTILPQALGGEALAPAHLTLPALAAVPIFFAYAILQRKLLGIRRLFHRGMVYGATTLVLVAAMLLALAAVAPALHNRPDDQSTTLLLALLVAGGVLVFLPLRRAVHWLVDRYAYRDTTDYAAALQAFSRDLPAPTERAEVASVLVTRLCQLLPLDSAIMLLGSAPASCRPIAMAGGRRQEVLLRVRPDIMEHAESTRAAGGVHEVRWQAECFIVAHLAVPERYLGYLLLGPKSSGDVFLEEEKLLLARVVPLFALSIDKSELSEELREVNRMLVRAGEAERTRMAADLHDGPLQKVLLLTQMTRGLTNGSSALAQEVVRDLREVCSRLRPAIIDDLGVVPAIEWLLEDVSRRSGLETRFVLDGVGPDTRFAPEIELALFRVAQEATNNSVKHAGAESIEASLSRRPNALVLTIADNGVGFVASRWRRDAGGFGLAGMRERMVQIGGSLEVSSTPGSGTVVSAAAPLTP